VGAGATAVGEGAGARAGEGTLRFRKRWEVKKARVIHEHIFWSINIFGLATTNMVKINIISCQSTHFDS
jgi:hypothetical protein